MLDDVERADQVVGAVGGPPSISGKRRAHYASAKPFLGDVARFLVKLERVDGAELRQHRKIVAGAAADLEDLGALGQRDGAADQRRKHLAASPIPPVTLIELSHMVIDDPLHQRKTHWRLRKKVTPGVMNNIGAIGAARPRLRRVNNSQTQKLLSA